MKVAVLCEFSGVVRDAFIAAGHDAISCDLEPTEKPGPHIQRDCRDYDWSGYDLIIAHPPCTYLCVAGLHYSKKSQDRMEKTKEAFHFFMWLYELNVERIAIENPVGIVSTWFRKPDQIINPYNFGIPERKKTCLWLKGLPKLVTETNLPPEPIKTIIRKSGSKVGQPYNYYWREGKSAKEKSRTFPGIAQAMANQWGILY